MKLSRTAWLILGIGVFIITFASLYMVYFQQGREQEQLDDSLLAAQATLPTLVSEKEGWESQLTRLKSQLARATSLLADSKTSFPKSVESIEYDEELFKIADGWGLEITSLTASEPGDKKVEDVTFSVTFFVVDVEGEVADILRFINTIATSEYFASATIELVNMDIPEPTTDGEEEKPSATITLVIYSYKGE